MINKGKKQFPGKEQHLIENKMSYIEKGSFTRRLFLRSLTIGTCSLGLSKIIYSKGRQGDLDKLYGWQTPHGGELRHYYAHDAVIDQYGVISPWYKKPNGQCDLRIRISAETLKRYPWTSKEDAVEEYPHYIYSSKWHISSDGTITPKNPGDWMNGDTGQRLMCILNGMVDYYRYSGDPAAIAHMTYAGDFLINHCLTPGDHSWPYFPISVPNKGKPYGNADSNGMIQLDLSAALGEGILRAYRVTKNEKWLDAAKHWGDLFAQRCNINPQYPPWPRYANPECANWGMSVKGNLLTGGITLILSFLDELIRLGYTGKDDEIITARDAGIRYLSDNLLPKWTIDETWGYQFWDWIDETTCCTAVAYTAGYMVKHKSLFPNWRNDVRNFLTLFLNRSSANPESDSDVYSGAWAYPETSSCCGRSLLYAPWIVGQAMAQYGVEANDPWMLELAYRQFILQTYDIHENGVVEDAIDGGIIVGDKWFNLAHPAPLFELQQALGWLPEQLGASRENHLVRSSAVVDSIVYGKDYVNYTTFDSPKEAIDVLRLSYVPISVHADGHKLNFSTDLRQNGCVIKSLPNGDAIVWIRHDGKRNILVRGSDPQKIIDDRMLHFEGSWTQERDQDTGLGSTWLTGTKGASVSADFYGNQIRVVGSAGPLGGLADVFIDNIRQRVSIDCWNPKLKRKQIIFYKNGLEQGKHTIKIVSRGLRNPHSKGNMIYIDEIQYSSAAASFNFPSGTGPTGPQRMIFGYTNREDYKDVHGNLWRPATEVVTRLKRHADTVKECWMGRSNSNISGTPDPELYRYGYHCKDFWTNITVGPGEYDVRLMFAAAQEISQRKNGFDIIINDKIMQRNFNVMKAANGSNKAVDLVFRKIAPLHGIIQVRLIASTDVEKGSDGEAFIQALEVNKNIVEKGVVPLA